MLLKFSEPRIFVDAVSIISELVSEVRMKITKNGLSVIAIDPANVALVSLKIPASAFSQLEAEEEQICLSLDDLKAVLRRCSASSSLILKKDEKENKLELELIDKTKRNFYLSLIDIEEEEKVMPSLDFNAKVELASDILSSSVEDAIIVADSCSFIIKKDKFGIESKGTLHSAKTELSSDECKISGEAKAKYSLEYLQKFLKASKLAEKCMLHFSDDYPCKLDFKNPKIEISFILAPRVETEED